MTKTVEEKPHSKKFKLKITKNEFICIGFLTFAFMFSLLVFGQFDILRHNQLEFGFSPSEVIGTYILLFFLGMLTFCSILLVCAQYCKILFYIVTAAMFGLLLASYSQLLFLNSAYDGAFIEQGQYNPLNKFQNILNFAIWISVFLLPSLFLLFEYFHKKKTFKQFVIFGCATIFAMQSIGLFTTFITIKAPSDDGTYFFSISEQFKLSANENIMVFLVDRLDTDYTDEVFNRFPETKKIFNGFTYYKDNMSLYPGTCPSIASLLTGKVVESTTTRTKFLSAAWAEATLFDELKTRNYRVNGLIEKGSVYMESEEIADKFDNYKPVKESKIKNFRTVKQKSALKIMSKLAFQRIAPYAIKSSFNLNKLNIATQCVSYTNADVFPEYPDDNKFKNDLQNLGLTKNTDKNTFSFIYMNGAHINGNINDDINGAYNSFKILDNYFTEMKDMEIFDGSTIIVLADHGRGNEHASLLIKRSGEKDEKNIIIDNTAEMSNGNFIPTILEIIGATNKKTALSYFDIHKKTDGISVSDTYLPQTRYYYPIQWWDGRANNILTYTGKWEVTGNSRNKDNWSFVA